jgi:hypothetical protein
MRLSILLTLAMAICLPVAPASAQTHVVLRDRAEPGLIAITEIAELGDENDATVGPFFAITVDGGGRYLTSPFVRRTEIMAFGADGQLQEVAGREGQGPGEYKYVGLLAQGAEMSHVFDSQNSRWTRLNADLTYHSSSLLDGNVMASVMFGDSLALINSILHTPHQIGFPLHLVNSTSGVVRSFGYDENEAFRSDVGMGGYRVLAMAGDNSVWAGTKTRYYIEEWTIGGELIRTFERNKNWFRTHYEEPMPDPARPPVPVMRALHQDAAGLLWVAVAIPDENWAEGIYKSEYDEGTGYQVSSWDDFFDTVIEVINPESGEVVASTRIDPYVWWFVGERQFATYTEDEGLWPKIKIWEMRLSESRDLTPIIDEAAAALQARDWEGVLALLRSPDRAVRLNKVRHAIQIVGCDESVAAHFPLPVETVERLSAMAGDPVVH